MGSKRKACKVEHPELNTRCWAPQHDDSEDHWAYMPRQSGRGVERVEWTGGQSGAEA